MLQNKFQFNQSSVSLEVTGVPDYSNNESSDFISIISQWKLTIIDQPLIEGNIEHLKAIIEAFYSYTNFLLNNDTALYESKLIDIKTKNYFTHDILLKSSKPNVEPLNIKIGNSVLADIINCFDQLRFSKNVKDISSGKLYLFRKKNILFLLSKRSLSKIFVPPVLSLCFIIFFTGAFGFFYYINEENNKNSLLDKINSSSISAKSPNTIV